MIPLFLFAICCFTSCWDHCVVLDTLPFPRRVCMPSELTPLAAATRVLYCSCANWFHGTSMAISSPRISSLWSSCSRFHFLSDPPGLLRCVGWITDYEAIIKQDVRNECPRLQMISDRKFSPA